MVFRFFIREVHPYYIGFGPTVIDNELEMLYVAALYTDL